MSNTSDAICTNAIIPYAPAHPQATLRTSSAGQTSHLAPSMPGATKTATKQKIGKCRKTFARTAREMRYNVYLKKMLKAVHPGMTISEQTLYVVSELLHEVAVIIAESAEELSEHNCTAMLTPANIKGALEICWPPEMARLGCAEVDRAVLAFRNSSGDAN